MSGRLLLVAALVVASLPVAGQLRESRADADILPAHCANQPAPTTTIFLPNITKTFGGASGWDTPFYVQNAGAVQTTVEATFYRFSDGTSVACRAWPSIAPGTSLMEDPNLDPNLPDDAQFSVVVKSYGAPVVATVNQVQGSGAAQQALSYAGFGGGAKAVFVPNVTRRFFGWDVPLIVQNLGPSPAVATATLTSVASPTCQAPHSYVRSFVVGPGRSGVVDPNYEAAFSGAPNSGLADGCQYSATVTSDQPVAVVANAHNEVGAPSAYSHNGITAGATSLYAPYATRSASLFSNVVVQNLSNIPVSAILSFTPLGPGAAQSFTLPAIPAGGAKPFDVRYTNGDIVQPFCSVGVIVGCLANGEYSLKITAATPIAAVILPVSATTAAGYLASAAPTPRALVPAAMRTIGGGAGWTSTLYVQSVTATQAMVRWYGINSGDLVGTQQMTLAPNTAARLDPRSVPQLADNTQYSATVEANGDIVVVVFEQAATGGDASMMFEAFSLPAQSNTFQAASIRITPPSASIAGGAAQQLSAVTRDQYGAAMVGAPITWSALPAAVGSIGPSGLFTAGTTSGTATVTATSGQVSATATIVVTAPTTRIIGGLSFFVEATASTDIFVESSISVIDRQRVIGQASLDVPSVETTFQRTFSPRPQIYFFATTMSYAAGLQTIFSFDPASAQAASAGSAALHDPRTKLIGADWSQVARTLPLSAIRHELTHRMERQIVAGADLPAWWNEGTAALQELTVPGSGWLANESRFAAASMAASGLLFSVSDLTSQAVWVQRPSPAGNYQYYQAEQMVQLIRNDLGMPATLRIFDLIGQGQTFEAAYAIATGQSLASFANTYAQRIRALAPTYPGIATAPDTFAGAGMSIIVYGLPPNVPVTVTLSGAASAAPHTCSVDVYGVCRTYIDSTFPDGAYTVSANWSGGTVTAAGNKRTSSFAPVALDSGETGPLELREYPPPQRD